MYYGTIATSRQTTSDCKNFFLWSGPTNLKSRLSVPMTHQLCVITNDFTVFIPRLTECIEILEILIFIETTSKFWLPTKDELRNSFSKIQCTELTRLKINPPLHPTLEISFGSDHSECQNLTATFNHLVLLFSSNFSLFESEYRKNLTPRRVQQGPKPQLPKKSTLHFLRVLGATQVVTIILAYNKLIIYDWSQECFLI